MISLPSLLTNIPVRENGEVVIIYQDKWLVVYLPLWKMMEFVSWEYEIPNWMEKNMFQITNQMKNRTYIFWVIITIITNI